MYRGIEDEPEERENSMYLYLPRNVLRNYLLWIGCNDSPTSRGISLKKFLKPRNERSQ